MIGTADAGFDAPFAILDLAIGLPSRAVSDSSISTMVGDENDGCAVLLQFVKNMHDVGTALRIEHGGRLVEHEDFGIHGKHAGDGDALLLASAHSRGIGFSLFAHIDCIK